MTKTKTNTKTNTNTDTNPGDDDLQGSSQRPGLEPNQCSVVAGGILIMAEFKILEILVTS